jgi:hypothetical protein
MWQLEKDDPSPDLHESWLQLRGNNCCGIAIPVNGKKLKQSLKNNGYPTVNNFHRASQ